jgi:putative ABC transport system substrate-binding protein
VQYRVGGLVSLSRPEAARHHWRPRQAATTALPIVFNTADDPVNLGLVASLAQPGGNVTGVSILSTELTAKRLELLHALAPNAIRIAVFINPGEPASDVALRELEAAGVAIGLQTRILRTSTGREIGAAFASFVHERPDALFFADKGAQPDHWHLAISRSQKLPGEAS